MPVDIGRITASATCQHCEGPLHFTRWSFGNDRWLHDATSNEHCPTSPVATPAPGNIIETGDE